MYIAKLIFRLLFSVVLLCPFASLVALAHTDQTFPLSTQMLKSIISRGQGLAPSNGKTSLIELGIFQSALRQSLAHVVPPADCTLRNELEKYMERSVESTLGLVSNATADIELPLDRLSVGTGILEQ